MVSRVCSGIPGSYIGRPRVRVGARAGVRVSVWQHVRAADMTCMCGVYTVSLWSRVKSGQTAPHSRSISHSTSSS